MVGHLKGLIAFLCLFIWIGSANAYDMTADELLYWRHKAACLDPGAYEHHRGVGVSITVPQDETWYMVAGLTLNGGGDYWGHRTLGVEDWMILPSDTTWETSPVASKGTGFMHVCKPELVIEGDQRYVDDPRGLYYERMRRLGELPVHQLEVYVPPGTSTLNDPWKAFPDDFEDAMLVHFSGEDIAWMTLTDKVTGPDFNVMVYWEIDNIHRFRYAERVLFPFKRSMFNKVKVAAANLSGVNGSALKGQGTVHYVHLPTDW